MGVIVICNISDFTELDLGHCDCSEVPCSQQYGDLAIVYHSVNTYAITRTKADKLPSFNKVTSALSMNLYGVALLAKWNSRHI